MVQIQWLSPFNIYYDVFTEIKSKLWVNSQMKLIEAIQGSIFILYYLFSFKLVKLKLFFIKYYIFIAKYY